MSQESAMICFDNSEWMRNGDFIPTRMQAEQDAANLVAQCKLRANPENAVGLLTMAPRQEILTTMTTEHSKLFVKLHQIQPKGDCNFISGIRVAHLALKHRQNRNHKMRIVMFVGSPMDNVDQVELVKDAKKLKKEKVSVDVVCFGEADSENAEKMRTFIDTLNGKEGTGSHLVEVPAGSSLTEALISSPVCRGEGGEGGAPPMVGPGGGMDFGMDGADDPELAMALRVSLEEQRARTEQQEGEQPAQVNGTAAAPTAPAPAATSAAVSGDGGGGGGGSGPAADPGFMTEEQQLEWALRMSMQEQAGGTTTASNQQQPSTTATTAAGAEPIETASADDAEKESDELADLMNDPDVLRGLVSDLPGVDPDSQVIRDAVNAGRKKKEDDKAKKGASGGKKDGEGSGSSPKK